MNYMFREVFLGLVLLYAEFVRNILLGVSPLRASSRGFGCSLRSALGCCWLLVVWRLLTLAPSYTCWIGYILVHIFPPLPSRSRTDF